MAYKEKSPIPVVEGGTGAQTLTGVLIGNGTSAITGNAITQYDVLVGGASNAISSVAPSATSGVPLISQGSSSNPAFGTAVVAGGGTGQTTLTNHGVLIGAGTSAITQLAVGATNSVLQGSTGADPSFTTTPTVTSISFGGSALSTFTDWTSWTPTVTGGSSAGSTTYSNQTGYYSRIGNIVVVQFNVTYTAATGTGNLIIGGLPLTINSTSNETPIGSVGVSGSTTWPLSTTSLVLNGIVNTTTVAILCSGSAVASGIMQIANTTQQIIGSLIYRV
jgi:hypothetical protein